jgi:hypothetical protein
MPVDSRPPTVPKPSTQTNQNVNVLNSTNLRVSCDGRCPRGSHVRVHV